MSHPQPIRRSYPAQGAPLACPAAAAESRFERLEPRLMLAANPSNAAREIEVATYNLYVGADVAKPMAAIVTGDPMTIIGSVTSYWQTVQATDFHARAAAIAQQIDEKDPTLIGLQEVASYYIGPHDPTTPATTSLVDFEQVLLQALSSRGLQYEVAARRTNADIEFPGFIDADPGLDDLRLVDHDLILARTDLKTSQLKLSNAQAGDFVTNLQFPTPAGPATVLRGWVSVDAKVRGKTVRFINTHLEPFSEPVQRAQAAEVVAGPADTSLPVIFVGDLNTAGDGSTTLTYADLQAAGFADAWTQARPGEPGYTHGQDEDLMNPVSLFSERLDFVLLRGNLFARDADVIGEEPDDRTPSGLWPSDHAGVVARIAIQVRPNQSAAAPAGGFSTVAIAEDDVALEELIA